MCTSRRRTWNSLRCARAWSLQRSVDDCRMLWWSSSSFARVCQRVSQNLSFSGAERDGWCWRCHLRSIYLPDFECRSTWRLWCERATQTSYLGSGLTQFEQEGSTQQIADYTDQLSNNRARAKDSKGNEQQVLVQVSARSTADRRSISL